MSSSQLSICETMEEEVPNSGTKECIKRRSSIFQRRSILLTALNNETEDLDETKTMNDISPIAPSEKYPTLTEEIQAPFDMEAYIEALKREKELWQDVLNERRSRYRNLIKKKAMIEKNGQEVDLSLLTDSERSFVEARPNYEHIVKSSKALVDMAVKITILNQHCTRLNKQFHDKMEQNINEATKKIISMVD